MERVVVDRADGALPLGAARNAGAAHLECDVLAFLDVDCIPSPSFVADHDAALATHGGALACGRVRYLRAGWQAAGPGHDLDELSAPHPARPAPARDELDTDRHELFWSLNFAVRTATWERLGGFDTGYRGYGAEDTDLGLRARRLGIPLLWVAGAGVLPPVAPADSARPRPPRRDRRQRPAVPRAVGDVADDRVARRAGGGRGRALGPRRGPARRGGAVTAVTSVVVGPEQHGVVRHALVIAGATGARVARRRDVASVPRRPAERVARSTTGTSPTGSSAPPSTTPPAPSAPRPRRSPGRHVVTLHDVPAATDGDRDRRRAAAYRRVAGCCDAVVVASEHERRRLAAADVRSRRGRHPAPGQSRWRPPSLDAAPRADAAGRTVGILGFIYPGKGHADVIAAAGALPADVRLVALGRASDGHDDLAVALQRAARRGHRELVVTGFLDDAALAAALDEVDVPIVPARDVSASASLGTWIAAGRRPLVVANDFAREVAAMGPDLVTLYEPERLGPALGAALADPASTRRAGAVPASLGIDAVAAAHVALYRRVDA